MQRLASSSVTVVMRTAPTTALEVILDLTALHLHVRKCSLLEAIRIFLNGKLIPVNWVGHMRILNQIDSNLLTKPSDIMPTIFDFETVIVDYPSAIGFVNRLDKNLSKWFTDGSKSEKGTGIEVYGPKLRISEALGSEPFILQTGIMADYAGLVNSLGNIGFNVKISKSL